MTPRGKRSISRWKYRKKDHSSTAQQNNQRLHRSASQGESEIFTVKTKTVIWHRFCKGCGRIREVVLLDNISVIIQIWAHINTTKGNLQMDASDNDAGEKWRLLFISVLLSKLLTSLLANSENDLLQFLFGSRHPPIWILVSSKMGESLENEPHIWIMHILEKLIQK